jgi:hypothetical protein
MAAQVEGNRAVVELTEKGKKMAATTANLTVTAARVDEKQGGKEVGGGSSRG